MISDTRRYFFSKILALCLLRLPIGSINLYVQYHKFSLSALELITFNSCSSLFRKRNLFLGSISCIIFMAIYFCISLSWYPITSHLPFQCRKVLSYSNQLKCITSFMKEAIGTNSLRILEYLSQRCNGNLVIS